MAHIHEKIDFTVSAFIVFHQKVLLINHKKLQMWLPVGGHVELDEDTDQALFREIEEESGLKESDLTVLSHKGNFDDGRTKSLWVPNELDIHRISETHQHIGLVFYLSSNTEEISLAETEHNDIRWFTQPELADPGYKIDEAIRYYCKQALGKMSERR